MPHCSHCNDVADFVEREVQIDDLLYQFIDNQVDSFQLLNQQARHTTSFGSNHFRRYIGDLRKFKSNRREPKHSLESLLPDNHPLFLLFEKVQELERNEGDNLAKRLDILYSLADSKRKFSKETRDWMKNKSPFYDSDFLDNWGRNRGESGRRLTSLQPFITKNIEPQLSEDCQKFEVICLQCGVVVRTYYDLQTKAQKLTDLLSTLPMIKNKLADYDKQMKKWKAIDDKKKAEKEKARLEKKRLADIAALEAEQKKVEEKLRKLKGKKGQTIDSSTVKTSILGESTKKTKKGKSTKTDSNQVPTPPGPPNVTEE